METFMNLEQQVVSLELAIKLKEAGIKEESLFAYYGNAGTWHDAVVSMDMYTTVDEEFKEHKLLPAYTSCELAELLPSALERTATWLTITRQWKKGSWKIAYVPDDGEPNATHYGPIEADTLADAMAKMLLHLKEKELLPFIIKDPPKPA